jgi:cell division protein FtsB
MQENKKTNPMLLIYLVIFFIALCTYGFGYHAGSKSDPLKVSQVMEASDEANGNLHAELSKCREELSAFQMRLRINSVAQMDSILADIKAKYAESNKK